MDDSTTSMPSSAVPVTILSGFLGSGKTTLLNYILSENHGRRIAVIENEFGDEVGVESLVAKDAADGDVLDGFYALSNGCVCCSVRDDLVETLERLLQRRDKFDYILVETTGMADPGKVAATFWVDAELEGRLYLDGIVTLVDSHNIQNQLTRSSTMKEANAQVAYADRILLNKKDLVDSEEERGQVESAIKQVNALATCRWTERGRVDLDDILEIRAFTSERAEEVEADLHGQTDHSNCSDECNHTHTGQVQTTCVQVTGKLDQDALERWLGTLLWEEEEAMQLFRIKGVVVIDGEDNKFIVQAVQELFEVYASKEPLETEQVSKIVFIGTGLDELELRQGLEKCLA